MKVPQVPAMAGMTPLGLKLPARSQDEKTVADRKWSAPLKPKAPQAPCDHGLFSDDKDQPELKL